MKILSVEETSNYSMHVILSADKRIRHKRQRILASDRGSVDGSTFGRGSTFDSMGRRWRTRGDTSTLMVVGRERGREGGRQEEGRE